MLRGGAEQRATSVERPPPLQREGGSLAWWQQRRFLLPALLSSTVNSRRERVSSAAVSQLQQSPANLGRAQRSTIEHRRFEQLQTLFPASTAMEKAGSATCNPSRLWRRQLVHGGLGGGVPAAVARMMTSMELPFSSSSTRRRASASELRATTTEDYGRQRRLGELPTWQINGWMAERNSGGSSSTHGSGFPLSLIRRRRPWRSLLIQRWCAAATMAESNFSNGDRAEASWRSRARRRQPACGAPSDVVRRQASRTAATVEDNRRRVLPAVEGDGILPSVRQWRSSSAAQVVRHPLPFGQTATTSVAGIGLSVRRNGSSYGQ
nr:hypothetical protein Iba_chr06bCG13330 [Ipomoea batatas]